MIGFLAPASTSNSIPHEVGISRYRELTRGQIAGASHGVLKLLGVRLVGAVFNHPTFARHTRSPRWT